MELVYSTVCREKYKKYEQTAKNIKYYRKLKGLTQDEVSKLTGYSPEYIKRIESSNEKK